jgi:sodium/potassium-transporting ATPase subunit alpha
MSEKPDEDQNQRADDENPTSRAVAFPESDEVDEKQIGVLRQKGAEIKRQMTQEDKELAAAGYEHLEEQKAKSEKATKLDQDVDLTEYRLPIADLGEALKTSIDIKEPSRSNGLTPEEATARLARDGRNVLTPPKKKSAFRKVYHVLPRKRGASLTSFSSTWIVF